VKHLLRRRGEEGVTLQDVLIAMAITGILMGTLTATMFTSWRTLGNTETRFSQSSGATVLASYFAPDVQNAVTVGVNTAETGACPSPRTVDLLLTTAADGSSSVSYFRGTGPSASVLYRRTCDGGVATPPQRLVRSLAVPPVFACSPDCGITWNAVTATVVQNDPTDPTNVGKRYTTNVEGTRRSS
jgi:hypothetical protein